MTQNKELQNAIIESNPWWKKKFDSGFKDRDIFTSMLKFLKSRQIIALTGLRRVGKTTIMMKIVEDKLKDGFLPEKIAYFSFDNFRDVSITDFIENYEQISGNKIDSGEYIFLLDEIQKIKNWEDQVKRVYDLHKNIKIIISGSESLFIRKKSKESLAGRMFEFLVEPLSFREFLHFKEFNKTGKIYSKEILSLFDEFICTGGFPELVDIKDKEYIQRYIQETIIEKIIFRDIPLIFPVRDISVLESIFKIISNPPGQMVEINKLASEIGISRRVVSLYLSYLENSFLIKKLYNFSKNERKTAKKLKKYYLTVPALCLKNDDNLIKSKIFENLVVVQTKANFFWRDAYKNEVDVVLTNKEITPIEVKYGKIADYEGLYKFMDNFNLKKGVIISYNEEKEIKERGKEIRVIPAYLYFLEKSV